MKCSILGVLFDNSSPQIKVRTTYGTSCHNAVSQRQQKKAGEVFLFLNFFSLLLLRYELNIITLKKMIDKKMVKFFNKHSKIINNNVKKILFEINFLILTHIL